MKTKKKKYLPLYEKSMKTGLIGTDSIGNYNGLCYSKELQIAGTNKLLTLFRPTEIDIQNLKYMEMSTAFWASGKKKDSYGNEADFTSLRQTIILFMCALNDEL